MSCKKSELVSAINSYCSARATNDGTLITFSTQLVNQLLDKIEFEPEEDSTAEEENVTMQKAIYTADDN